MNTCLVFACSGESYAREAVVAAARAQAVMPEQPCVGFADADGAAVFRQSELFVEVHEIANPAYSFIDKTRIDLPQHYDAGLYLDGDIYLVDTISEIFTLLTRFDLVVAHEPTRFSFDRSYRFRLDGGAPAAFPEFNTGVLGFRNTPEVAAFFDAWRADNAAREAGPAPPAHDQPAFRTALWNSGLRFYVLPPELNFRFAMPSFIGGFAGVRVLHGRGRRRARLARRLRRAKPLPRSYQPWYWPAVALQKRIRRWRRRMGIRRAGIRNLRGRL